MPVDIFDAADFPQSYKHNMHKEKLVLAFADNYRRQYIHLYRDRKPLLLYPVNELGLEVRLPPILMFTSRTLSELGKKWASDYLFLLYNYSHFDPKINLKSGRLIR